MWARAQAQPNIALIKYWGKRDQQRNLPAVGSISVTLESLWTRTSVEFDPALSADLFTINDAPDPAMIKRVSRCLDQVAGVNRAAADIVSHCNFPVAAGLASSASAFAALVVAANSAAGEDHDRHSLANLAGAASGSAARSLFGGIVELVPGNDDVLVSGLADQSDWPLSIVVAITEESAKPVGSGDAMIRSAGTSPFYSKWVEEQDDDLYVARDAIQRRDFEKLATIAEHNCLKMHSVMWTSRPPLVYWNKATLACMQTVRELQAAGRSVFFTIDAGPQLKAVCLPEDETAVNDALLSSGGVIRTMCSGLGAGARIVEQQ